jgi:hypothetical protein
MPSIWTELGAMKTPKCHYFPLWLVWPRSLTEAALRVLIEGFGMTLRSERHSEV